LGRALRPANRTQDDVKRLLSVTVRRFCRFSG
jgi:hypothetical protein